MVSTRLRCRLFSPWIENPCSRVLRKLSGELTTIQYWAVRTPPDLRFRLERPDLAGACGSVWAVPGASVTDGRLLTVRAGRAHRAQIRSLGEQRAQVADLAYVAHLMPSHQTADLEQRHLAPPRIGDRAVPFRFAPTVEEVDGAAPHPCEILECLLERTVQLLIVPGVDRRSNIGSPLAIEVRVPEQAVDARRRVDQGSDQAAEGRECRAVPVAKASFIKPVDEVAGPFRHRAQEQHDVRAGHLLLQFHRLKVRRPSKPRQRIQWAGPRIPSRNE